MTNLKRIRKESGLTQSQLAEKIGLSVRMVQQYEQAQNDINKAAGITLYQLAKALDCTMEELLDLKTEE